MQAKKREDKDNNKQRTTEQKEGTIARSLLIIVVIVAANSYIFTIFILFLVFLLILFSLILAILPGVGLFGKVLGSPINSHSGSSVSRSSKQTTKEYFDTALAGDVLPSFNMPSSSKS